jgi:L-threonylcarbamoyladenylate synthase
MAARVLAVDAVRPEPAAIRVAADMLAAGQLVAFPTETVYGLGADAFNAAAVDRVFTAKGRPADNPTIVHVASPAALDGLVTVIPPAARTLIARLWPGPLTLVLPAAPSVPAVTRGGLATVAVRMPSHPVALALITAAARPVAAPSANRSGRPSPTTARHVLDDLGGAVSVILDAGPSPLGVESTVLDLSGERPVLLRPGGVPLEALESLLGPVAVAPPNDRSLLVRSPGTRYRHYAPRATVVLVDVPPAAAAREVAVAIRRLWEQGLRVGVMVTAETAAAVPSGAVVRVMGPRAEPAAIAANLFAQMRDLDDAGLDAIVVEGIEERGMGRAVMDRLRRAAGPRA